MTYLVDFSSALEMRYIDVVPLFKSIKWPGRDVLLVQYSLRVRRLEC